MTTPLLSSNGVETTGGDNNDRISTNTLIRWALVVCGSVLTILFTRWLSHIDKELDTLKASIIEIRKEAWSRHEAFIRVESKLDAVIDKNRSYEKRGN